MTDLQAREEKEMGNAAYKKKDFETALTHYNKAVELDPTDITYLNNIAGKVSFKNTVNVSFNIFFQMLFYLSIQGSVYRISVTLFASTLHQ